MKKILIALLVAAMALSAVSCGEKTTENTDDQTDTPVQENGETEDTDAEDGEETAAFDYMAEDLTKYVKLGQYEGLEATMAPTELTDEEFDTYIASLLESYSDYEHITDRAVEAGETVILQYRGDVDGEDFTGTMTDTEVIAADDSGYIPGFGSGLVGKMPGEEFTLDLTFPDPYTNNTDLSGKEAVFTITIDYIVGTELITPELTADFVKETFNYDSVDEYLAAQRKTVEMQKEYYETGVRNEQLWNQIVENAEVIEYPQEAVDATYAEARETYEYYASYYNVDYETFLSTYVGITDEDLLNNVKDGVKEDLVMYQMIKTLDAEITDAEYEGKVAYFAEMYGATVEDFENYYGADSLRMIAQYDKVMSMIANSAVITEAESTFFQE